MKTRVKELPTNYSSNIVQSSQNNTINSSLAQINTTIISNNVYNKLHKRSNSHCLQLLKPRQSVSNISKTNFDISTILGN